MLLQSQNMNSCRWFIIPLFSLVFVLTACSNETNRDENTAQRITLPVTAALKEITSGNLTIQVIVDEGEAGEQSFYIQNLIVTDTGITGDAFTLTAGPHTLKLVYFIEDPDLGSVEVAKTVVLNIDVVGGQSSDADFSGGTMEYLDADQDQISNLDELRRSTNPNIADVPEQAVIESIISADSTLTVSWQPVTGAESYTLYWSEQAGQDINTMQAITNVQSAYIHQGLSNGTSYFYKLVAENIAGQSAPSAEMSGAPLAPDGTTSAFRAPLPTPLQSAVLPPDGTLVGQIFVDDTSTPAAEKSHSTDVVTIEFLFESPTGLHTFSIKYIFQDAQWGDIELTSGTSDAIDVNNGDVHDLVIADAAYTYPDNDSDGISNLQEVINGTDPNNNDTTAPQTSPSPSGGTYAPISVILSCDDGAGSGCLNTYVTTDSNAALSEFDIYTGPVDLAADTDLRFFSDDNAGNREAVKTESYVIDLSGPTANCDSPLPNAADVPLNAIIGIQFSEPVDPTSVTSGSVILTDDNGATVTGQTTLATNGTSLTFAPGAPLDIGTIYTTTVTSTIKDLVGNDIAELQCVFTSVRRPWSSIPPMPTGRSSPASGVINGKIFVAGGYTGSYSSAMEEYNIATGSWRVVAPMPTNRAYLAGGVVNDIFYATGGLNSGSAIGTVESYNPVSNSWTTRQAMGIARRDHGVAVHNGLLYAVGGQTSNDESNAIEAYNPSSNSWTTKLSMPTPRARLGVAELNGIIYAVGGEWNGQYLDVLEAYDIATNSWTTLAPMPTARTGVRLAAANNRLYAIGGYTGSYLDITEVYNPATDTWSTTSIAAMNVPRYSASSSVFGNHIYMLGGYGNSRQQDAAEVLILPPDQKLAPVAEFTVRDIPPDGVPDVFVGGSPPPKYLFVKLTEDRAILEFDISALPTTLNLAKLTIAMSTLDSGGTIGSMYMYTFDANGIAELKDFYSVGTPITFDGPNVSGDIPVSFDVTASVLDARNRGVDHIGFMFRIAAGTDRYDFVNTDGLLANRPHIEVFR